jgi:hypothetical protein
MGRSICNKKIQECTLRQGGIKGGRENKSQRQNPENEGKIRKYKVPAGQGPLKEGSHFVHQAAEE